MSVATEPTYSDADLGAEIEGLRQDTLQSLNWIPPLAGLAWFYHAMVSGWPPLIHIVPLVALTLVALGTHRLARQSYALGSWFFLLGIWAVSTYLLAQGPQLAVLAVGVVLISMASALVSVGGAALITCLTMGAAALARGLHWGGGGTSEMYLQAHALYILSFFTGWLVTRPLRTSTTIALAGWEQTRQTLLELRQRRSELYGTVRSLEEAIRRIEHSNNELLVARREAETARALKVRFASTVSHEMRSPLNLILGFSKLMALSPESYGEALPQPYRADIYTVFRNCEHLVSLVDDILDLSQIEAQRLPLLKSQIDINSQVVGDAVEAMCALIERKGLALHLDLAEGLPDVLADPARLRQVVLNLLTNAVRLTEKGMIALRTVHQGDRILVSVADSGPGISESDISRLFREFHQLTVTDKRYEGGSGLGLAICKYLVELHGGEIWVDSKVGQGTTFTFSIPVTGDEVTAGKLVATGDLRRLGQTQPICLIVHDDPGIMRLLVRHLVGYHMVGVSPGEGLGSLVQDLHPMAILASPELRPTIRTELQRWSADLPILDCALPRASAHGELEGVLGYLLKPIIADMVQAFVKRVDQGTNLTVLLVDDEPDAVRLLERILTALPHPYSILRAYNGLEALEVMQRTVPDIVFLDLIMPQVNGRQVVAQMRSDPRLARVPVVVISGQDWIERSVLLGQTFTLTWQEPVSLARGVCCLQALLDGLAAAETAQPRATDPHGQKASEAPPPRPKPTPAAAGR